MPKILSVVPYQIFPAKLGGQKGIALFNEYVAKVADLTCVTIKANLPVYAKGYALLNIFTNGPGRYMNLSYAFKLRKIISDSKFTHLLLEHPYFGWLGLLLKSWTHIKLIVHSHNIESVRWRSLGKWWWKILWLYEKQIHQSADYNFFIHDEDRLFAIREYNLKEQKCITITYGIEWDKAPSAEEKNRCKELIKKENGVEQDDMLFLFNGTLNYKPNLDAVIFILEKINPVLSASNLKYKILICGKGLPDEFGNLNAYRDKNIIYKGFVDDISLYFKGADIFLNPIMDGGGIKTKLVEALGYNTRCISSVSGSTGVNVEDTNGQLILVNDNDWKAFAETIISIASQSPGTISPVFYEKFYWGNIAAQAVKFIDSRP